MPGCGHPSFLAFKDGHNAVQTLGIFSPNKAKIRRILSPEHGYLIPGGVLRSILGANKGRF